MRWQGRPSLYEGRLATGVQRRARNAGTSSKSESARCRAAPGGAFAVGRRATDSAKAELRLRTPDRPRSAESERRGPRIHGARAARQAMIASARKMPRSSPSVSLSRDGSPVLICICSAATERGLSSHFHPKKRNTLQESRPCGPAAPTYSTPITCPHLLTLILVYRSPLGETV